VTLGATRVGGIDLGSPRARRAMAAIAALSAAPKGFTVGELAAKVHHLGGQDPQAYTVRQAAYDLRELRAKQLVKKPGRSLVHHLCCEFCEGSWVSVRVGVTAWVGCPSRASMTLPPPHCLGDPGPATEGSAAERQSVTARREPAHRTNHPRTTERKHRNGDSRAA
jgi:hypothetical protein